MSSKKRAFLVILDGFGIGKSKEWDATQKANMPFYRSLAESNPKAQLLTHGEFVGLPKGIMGNSEVGHTTIGAGRIVYQDLTRISKHIETGEFFRNSVLLETITAGKNTTGTVHLMGLLSDGGVHSTIEHVLALLDLCVQQEVPKVSVHCFLDGRDTPPDSSFQYLEALLRHPSFGGKNKTKATIATVCGRYYAMDRDKRWDRVERAYLAMTGQVPPRISGNAIDVVREAHAAGKTDEFVEPVLLDQNAAMKDGDSVIFFNFRSDRAREISTAITVPGFKDFDRKNAFRPSVYTGMTQYDKTLDHVRIAFGPQNLDNILGRWLEKHNLRQFRIAETEKYAHVTFFFNGGREQPFEGEDRLLVSSPRDVATYDLKPEMSALAVAGELAPRILAKKYDFILVNFANPDMVGHTGNFDAAVKALEAIDQCLAQVITAARDSGYEILITADHGNSEEMRDPAGKLHTQHTLNPVPILWIPADPAQGKSARLRDGGLQDIMPTLCELMQLPTPPEATGKTLIQRDA